MAGIGHRGVWTSVALAALCAWSPASGEPLRATYASGTRVPLHVRAQDLADPGVTGSIIPSAPAAAIEESATEQPIALPDDAAQPRITEPALPAVPEAETHTASPAPEATETAPETAEALEIDPLRQRIAELLTSDTAPLALRQHKDFNAVAAAYQMRDNRPFWIEGNALNEAARAAVARIARADEDGLDAAAYRLPALDAVTPEALARAEIELSIAVASFARHAQAGRLAPGSISAFITVKPEVPDTATVLAAVSQADDVAGALDAYNPPHPEFQALKAALARARTAERAEPLPVIPAGRLIRPGNRDSRVPALRARLALPPVADTEPGHDVYDEALADAVRAFQARKGLNAESIVGPLTIEALNDEVEVNPVADIIVNMERWRWLPRDLGAAHILVNIPDYRLELRQDGKVIHETDVIVGTVKTQTPVFSDAMSYLVVNPSWGVPYSIVKRDMLPALRNDPTYLQRRGIQVSHVIGGRSQVLDSTRIDWHNTNLRGLNFRQPPGDANALGRIKFMFPNEHAVYLHDTPTRNLFNRTGRALSNGCVRVKDPFELAGAILKVTGGMDVSRVKAMIGGGEKRVNLPESLPIHLAYFTVSTQDDGSLVRRADVYGHDRRMRDALGLGG